MRTGMPDFVNSASIRDFDSGARRDLGSSATKGLDPSQIKDLDLASIRAVADIGCTFRFLDYPFTISTNRLKALSCFQKMYADFLFQMRKARHGQSDYYVIDDPQVLDAPFIWADEKIYVCPQPHLLPSYAHSVITNSIMARIRSHLIFHAAAVSWQGRGMVILGDSCHGKSTITLELIRRGGQFLTDDVTCLHRRDHRIYPFPRAIGLRQSAFGLFKGFIDADFHSSPLSCGGEKIFLLASDIPAARISDPCLPKFLICLFPCPARESRPAGSGDESQPVGKYLGSGRNRQDDKKFLYLSVDRFKEEMIKDLTALPGVEACENPEEKPFPVIKLAGRRGAFLLPDIEAICSRHRVTLIRIAKSEKVIIDYSREPYLERIPKSVAMRELLRGFRGGWTSAVLKEANSGMASMLFELSTMMKGVECYRMIPGRLEKMSDLLYDLAEG